MESNKIERIELNFKRRYRIKKLVNLFISILISVSGIVSLLFIGGYSAIQLKCSSRVLSEDS